MFTQFRREPKAYATKTPGATGSLKLLMDALKGVGVGAGDISKQAGTAVAGDRLAAMTPEERSGTQVMDKLQGLALTDQFRKRLEGGEQDAVRAGEAETKNIFTTERDETLARNRQEGDYRRSGLRKSEAENRAKLGLGKAIKQTKLSKSDEDSLTPLDDAIQRYTSDIAANDTQDGVGLDDKLKAVKWMKKKKFDILRQAYSDPDARAMSGIKDTSLSKILQKRITGNVFEKK